MGAHSAFLARSAGRLLTPRRNFAMLRRSLGEGPMAEEVRARSGLAQRAIRFAASVLIALLVGKALEIVAPGNIHGLVTLQNEAYAGVSAFDPWNVFRSYVCNVEDAGLNGSCSPVPRGAEGLNPFAPPAPQPAHGMGLLSPIVALFAVIGQLVFQPSVFGSLVALLQFAAGFAVMLSTNRDENKPAVYWYLWFPLGVVFFACVAGWLVQIVMLAGLGLFGWFTRIAGLCCGGGLTGLFGYEFSRKAVELKTHEIITKKLTGE
jgi:hypothetical protein